MKVYREKIRPWVIKYRFRLAIISIFLCLCLAFLWPRIFITIRSGERGVLYSRLFGGTVMDHVYEEGIHVILPWDIMNIYTIRVQAETQTLNVLTRDGLVITIQITLRYQLIPDKLPVFHRTIGPDYHRKIILPIINAAVRQTIGSYRPKDLYSTALQNLHDQILVDMVEELGPIPIIVHGVVVKNIHLPKMLNEAIEKKLVAEQEYLRYQYVLKKEAQEAMRKKIEGGGIKAYQKLVNENMTPAYLQFEGIRATLGLAKSDNAKVVVIGSGKGGLPLILNPDSAAVSPVSSAPSAKGKSISLNTPPPTSPTNAKVEPQKAEAAPKEPAVRTSETSNAPDSETFFEALKRLDKTILSTN